MMKKVLILTGLTASIFIALYSCTNDRKQKNSDTFSTKTSEVKTGKPKILNDIPWSANLDTLTQQYNLAQNNIVKTEELDSNNVIEAINRKYPENKLVWEAKHGDTAFVKIPESSYLTQSSGTTGAQVFLAESTYSITEIPGINFVKFDFKIGDHASPGVYQRKDFNFSMSN